MSDDFEILNDDENLIPNDENFDEVLELTTYTENESGLPSNNNEFIVAEYDKIDVVEITKNQAKSAKKFIQETKKLIISYANDNVISAELSNYVNSIANLQMNQLSDLLSLVVMNKKMLENMVHRINSVQAEDYALIQTYTALLQQHLKLHRELQISYTTIPSLMRKMLIDINPDFIDENSPQQPVVSPDYGETQFNNAKELLNKLKNRNKK